MLLRKAISHELKGLLVTSVRFMTERSDSTQKSQNLTTQNHGWEQIIYGNVHELLPVDVPQPLGPEIVITMYIEANLCHNITTGKSVTGVLHLLNHTVIDYYTKK